MNIKVAAFTVSEKSVNTWIRFRDATQNRQNNSDNQSKEKRKDQESMQSSTTPDPERHKGK